jgi:hypothetical protein
MIFLEDRIGLGLLIVAVVFVVFSLWREARDVGKFKAASA